MTQYQIEMLDVLRRIAERGKALAEKDSQNCYDWYFDDHIDLWIHMLDEIQRLKNSITEYQ